VPGAATTLKEGGRRAGFILLLDALQKTKEIVRFEL
jgi:hypothetical protein